MDGSVRAARPETVVLVEGVSDEVAVTTLARRRGRDLATEGVRVVAMGGATNIVRFLGRFGPDGAGTRLAGLCDLAEERFFRRGLVGAGLAGGRAAGDLDREGLAGLGFFVCVRDLEEELIRSLGAAAVLDVVAAQGELARFRILQQQPAHRQRPVEQQLRRFLGTHSGRKAQYARALVEALDPDAAPRPLERLLAHLRVRP
ncbi:TOPRIM nucleotidyl transferase/hydrolase domain-containing protein [Nocardioides mesophilus]|uniref:ATP-dependent endonuclease n=1 Tax=Nocardioides mesophilus TaxID=433659 RepID=A0A7G9RA36_9ACTN|nr:TOPRIM nucleotidyl transferase/hydrolase domain-containing protein [Nocardioides mesophilus]QNN52461.1 ATP-dependent endonuclease [Nocardioides mesophilus]